MVKDRAGLMSPALKENVNHRSAQKIKEQNKANNFFLIGQLKYTYSLILYTLFRIMMLY